VALGKVEQPKQEDGDMDIFTAISDLISKLLEKLQEWLAPLLELLGVGGGDDEE
jgi:hypothetical protein